MDYEAQHRHGLDHADEADLQAGTAAQPGSAGRPTQILMPGADNVVVLPAGVELDNVQVVGRDLVIVGEDGVRYVIPDGAILVPQLVVEGVSIPPANLAALLIGNEPEPAAGPARSSGGDFASPVGPLQAAYGLGNLLPYTELNFPQQQTREIIPQAIDHQPSVFIVTPDQPAGASSATSQVDEAGLPARGSETPGSDSAANSETTAGTIAYDSPDGLRSVMVNDVAITAVGQTITTSYGVLTITSIAPGAIGYSYTLADNVIGPNPVDSITVTVTDTDGDTATASLDISVLDDVPDARSDTDTVAAGTYGPETGNVVTGAGTTSGAAGADTQGADGASVTAVSGAGGSDGSFDANGNLMVAGDYGTLLIKADGSYSYTRNAGTPGGVTDTFTYTLTDGDGSSDTATLTVNIANSPVSIISVPTTGAGTIVDESGLPPRTGEAPGTSQGSGSNITVGTITYSAPDGPATIVIGGVTIVGTGQVIDLPQGTLTISSNDPTTGTIGYTFTLTDNTAGDSTTVTIPITVTDVDGQSDSKPLVITIVDDVPHAFDDAATQASQNASVTIDVLANDIQGADSVQPGAVAMVPGTLSGAGTLVYNGDGSFTYNPAPAEQGTVTFDYTITDGDGDTSTASVTITLLPDTAPTAASGAAATSDAAGDTDAGSNVNAFTAQSDSGSLAFDYGVDGKGTFAASYDGGLGAASTASAGGITTITGTGWNVTIDETSGAYTFTQTAPYAHAAGASSDSAVVTVTITDSDGSPKVVTLGLTIADDVPHAADDGLTVIEGHAAYTGGNVLANDDVGADTPGTVTGVRTGTEAAGAGTALVVGTPYDSAYGTLTLNADGSYTYTPHASVPSGTVDVFTYTVTDADGDSDTAELRFTFNGDANVPTAASGAAATSDAAGDTDAGSNVNAFTAQSDSGSLAFDYGVDGKGTFAASYDGGLGAASTASAGGITTITGTGWNVTIDETSGAYTFTQTAPYAHAAGASSDSAVVTVTITDSDGSPKVVTLGLTIADDVPHAADDGLTVIEGHAAYTGGNVLANDDVGADTPGTVTGVRTGTEAAGAGTALVVGTPYDSAYGTLTLNADGSYTYTPHASVPSGTVDVFTYTVTDADGDSDTAELRFTFNGDANVPTAASGAAATSDAAGDTDAGSNVNAFTAQSDSGSLAFDYGVDGKGTFAASYDGGLGAASTASAGGITTITGTGWNVTIDETSGAYTFTQTAPYAHAAGASSDSAVVTVTITDSDGSPKVVTLGLTIADDVPHAADDGLTVIEGHAAYTGGNVLANDDVGADTPGTVTGVRTGTEAAGAGTALVVGTPYDSAYGTLTLNADGSYTYTPHASVPSGTVDVFTYTVTDADGDSDTAELRFTFNGDANVPTAASGAAATSDAAGDTDAGSNVNAFTAQSDSGSLAFDYGVDGKGTFAASYDGGLGAASTASAGGITTITGTGWNVTIDETSGAYTFTQTAPYAHAAGASSDSAVVTVTITDSDGSPKVVTLGLTIADDVPHAADDGLTVIEGHAAYTGGNVLANDDVGADTPGTVTGVRTGTEAAGAGTALVVGTPYDSAYGTLTLNADGSYTYTPHASVPSGTVDVFTYTVTDADGDSDTAELRFTFNGDANVPTAASGAAATSDAAGDTDAGSNVNAFTAQSDSGSLAFDYGVDGKGTFAASYDGGLGAASTASAGGITTITGTGWNVTIDETSGAYTFTQTAPYAHAAGASSDSAVVTVTITDSDGSPKVVTLGLTIADDVPHAADDGLTVIEGHAAYTGGNVLANDDVGADTPGTVTGVRTGTEAAGAGTALVVGTPYDSAYGTLTLNADGSYTYTPHASVPSGTVDVFTYTVTDADGDSDTAELRFTFNGDANVPTAASGAAATSDAAGDTDAGSNVNAFTAQSDSGSLAFDYGVDGKGTFAASYDGGLGAASTASAGGITTITGTGWNVTIDETSGAYTFTQTAPYAHAAGASSDSAVVTVTITDSDGSPKVVTLGLTIADDVPHAADDGLTVIEGHAAYTGGNVLANDDVGADTPGTVTGVRTGTEAAGAGTALVVGTPYDSAYGTLTLNADGSYTYTPHASVPSGTVDVFTYTVTDADGDSDTAELRFTFNGDANVPTAASGAAATSDAAGDTDAGSNVNAFTAQSDSGSLAFDYGVDGKGTFAASYDGGLGAASTASAGGITTITGTGWNVTIDETSGAYTFTQTAPYAHAAGASSDSAVVTVTITDSDGSPKVVTLGLTIADDVPHAADDGLTVIEGHAAYTGGNVLANDDVGADTPGTVTGVRTGTEAAGAGTALVVGTPYDSAYGTLTLNADGSYTYTPHASVPSGTVDVFTYTVTDADGDSDTAELRFTFNGDANVPTAASGAAATSDAAGDTDAGSNVNAFTAQSDSGSLAFDYGVDGKGTFAASYDGGLGAASTASAGGITTITGTGWNVTIDETSGAYTFTQTAPYAHAAGASSDSAVVTVTITDSDGSPKVVTLGLTIADDVPHAADDGLTVIEGHAAYTGGNVLANDDVGADTPGTVTGVRTGTEAAGAGTALVVGTPYDSAYGTLTLNADGSYTYTPHASVPSGTVDVFTYTVTDADGDSDTAELRFTFNGDANVPTAASGAAATSDAAGDTDAGSNVNAFTAQSDSGSLAFDYGVDGKGTFAASYDGGLGAASTASAGGITTITGTGWNVTIDETSGAYTFTQTAPYAHAAGASSDSAVVTVTITDSDGSPKVVTLGLTIADDVPHAADDGLTVIEGHAAYTGGNVLANDDVGADTPGTVTGVRTGTEAAGAGTALVVGTPYDSAYGTLTLNADGSYTYTPHASVPSGTVDVFTYTVTDADGDSDTAELRFTFNGDANVPTAAAVHAVVDDDGLATGNHDSATGDRNANFGFDNISGTGDDDLDGAASSEASFSGNLGFNYGGDGAAVAGKFAFTTANGAIVGQETVDFSYAAGVLTATIASSVDVSRVGLTLFTVNVNEITGAYTVNLERNVLQAAGGNENDATLVLGYAVKDADNSTADGTLTVTFNDDMPSPYSTAPDTATGVNAAGTIDAINSLHMPAVGADLPGTLGFGYDFSATIAATNSAGNALTTSTGEALYYTLNSADPTILEARTSSTPGAGTLAFQIDLDPATNNYTYHQYVQLAERTTVPVTDLSSVGGGNVAAKGIDVPSTTLDLLLSTQTGNTVNTNATQIGVGGGNSMDGGENLRFDFLQNVYVTGSGGTAVLHYGEYYSGNAFREDISGLAAAQRADFIVRAITVNEAPGSVPADPADGDNAFYGDLNDTIVQNGSLSLKIYDGAGVLVDPATYGALGISVTAAAGGGFQITGLLNNYDYEILSTTAFQAVQIETLATSSSFKLGAITVSAFRVQGVDFDVPVKLTDADGDSVTSAIHVTLNAPPPIALDLDGNGVSFVSKEAGITFDYSGDGVREATAWVGPHDGLLVHDANGNRVADNGSEIVFSVGGSSDLEGLRQLYDSNHDGVFDANDPEFTKFGVWQDANQNGVTDPGEFHTLAELGITGIGLTSDGVSYVAAGGDVLVKGEASFVRDGTSFALADASFATAPVDRRIADGSTTAAATAAAGVASVAAAAAAVAAVLPETTDAGAHTAGQTIFTNAANIVTEQPHPTLDAPRDTLTDHWEPAEGAKAPPQSHSAPESVSEGPSNLVAAIDHSQPAGEDYLAAGPAFATQAPAINIGFADQGAMASLMAMGGGASPTQNLANAVTPTTIQDAMSDVRGSATIDAMVDHYAGVASGNGPAIAMNAGDAASHLLAQTFDGAMHMPMAAVLPDMMEDAHALAVATA